MRRRNENGRAPTAPHTSTGTNLGAWLVGQWVSEALRFWRTGAASNPRVGSVQREINVSGTGAQTHETFRRLGARLIRNGGRGGELAVDPGDSLLDPLFHPVDLVGVAAAHVPVGPDGPAEDAPAFEVPLLRLIQLPGHGIHFGQDV